MKAWLKFAAVGLVLVIAALAFIPFLVNANTFVPRWRQECRLPWDGR